jgi:hypothetical protein
MPTLTQVINNDDRPVVDVTSIDSRLFVLRWPSQKEIQVYDTKKFMQQPALPVNDLSDYTEYCGLTSCVTNNCVYVSDHSQNTIYRVELSGNHKVFSFLVDGLPSGLSINTAYNLLVACFGAKKIREYTTSGSLVREICIKLNDVKLSPWHAVQLTSDRFVVSCWNETNKVSRYNNATSIVYDVVEVDTNGQVVVSYTNQLQSTTQHEFNNPRRLIVDKNDKFILVADRDNDRIMILNRLLKCCAHELNAMSVDSGLQRPTCLHFDTSQNRLYVGEGWSSQHRILQFDNVI